ncbi:methyltransferase [Staphylothermus marinus F1]|uniref:Methyltransferase n=1 Tax=Staphylothermus marinus (strain ATCC 43588 / DSM 3639 / JCM 9404 / F1) TaxID=399550 RepID=A3DPA7_STAMF|nr:class I SAM-dependent methyltransferase family protein [Staphylothermus marinus]ABN70467.1 methyltransferase [Staphylothermus marinus F1]
MTRGKLLKKLAIKVLGEEKARKIWGRIEIIGDIAIIRVPFDIDPYELKPLAETIVEELKYVKSVWAGLPGVKGPYRLRPFIHLAGEDRSETIYKEHGCLFKIDITKVYVSPTLNYEHKRIAQLVKPGEIITNMFAGAGFFSIIIARYSKPKKVYSIDINPHAYRYMVENIRLNKVEDIVVPLMGDAAKVIEEKLVNTSDRVLMPYPELALDYLVYALKALRNRRGWIHIYLHIVADKSSSPLDIAENILKNKLQDLSVKKFDIMNKRIVRTIGPRKYQVVLDVHIY